tara:strand:- start:814 stop:1023 length:210 start_codon:yes stop_codon:yes gene_type:complete
MVLPISIPKFNLEVILSLNLIKVFRVNLLLGNKKDFIFADLMQGTLAQLVEQRTENPCVPGSIPGGTTL